VEKFSFFGFLWRVLFALAMVLLTFNPTGYSYVHWVGKGFPSLTPLQAVAGLSLLILWIFLWRSMMQAIGMIGFVLMAVWSLRSCGCSSPGAGSTSVTPRP
jgi:hypothetical protein